MTIEAFATLLGKNVVLTTPKGKAQGQLGGVEKIGDDGALFKINVLGFILAIPVIDGEEWSLDLSDDQPTPPPTKDSFESEWNDGTGIMIEPTNLGADVKWALFIPPTMPTHVDEDTGECIAPWGTTYWSSLTAALASLALARKNGSIVFADGRVAS